jgi:hypothetical protein
MEAKGDKPEQIDVFTDFNKSIKMNTDQYMDLIKSETLSKEDFNKLKNKLNNLCKLIGFKFIYYISPVDNLQEIFKYSIEIDFDLTSVKGSFLDILCKIHNHENWNKSVYFDIDNTLLTHYNVIIAPKICKLTPKSGERIINTDSANEAYKIVLDTILQKIATATKLQSITKKLDIPNINIYIASLLGHNMSFSKKISLNPPVIEYLIKEITNAPNSLLIMNYVKKRNTQIYKIISKNMDNETFKKTDDMIGMGFADD